MSMIHGLSFSHLRGDLAGGVVAAVVALPLALAVGVAPGAGAIAGVAGNLTIYGPSILNGDITTGGDQSYTGNTTIYATDVNISSVGSSSAGGDITFTGNIDGQTEDSNSLFILSGTGDAEQFASSCGRLPIGGLDIFPSQLQGGV